MSSQGDGSRPDVVAALLEIIRTEPGLTGPGIFYSLQNVERTILPSPTSVERTLRRLSSEVHCEDGHWYPGAAPTLGVATSPEVAPTIADPSQFSLEDLLRRRLAGRRLIAEVGLDADLFEQLLHDVEAVLRTHTQEGLARTRPYTFVNFLVGHGVYNYKRGNYWGTMPVRDIDNAAGPLFRRLCRSLGIEDFDHLVEQDNAVRYVAPILAHGGIPKYCLDDFFTLVIKDLQRGMASAEELLAHWRTRKTAFFNADKPVGRFLLHGGDLATDLLDRCVSAINDIQLAGRLPTVDEAGLPPYILLALRRHLDTIVHLPPRRIRGATSIRPEVVLDPWSPLGPELVLPPVRTERSASWWLWSARGAEELATSSFEARHVILSPAKVWNLELREHGSPTREWSFEAFDDAPVLFFDARTGHALSAARSIRGDFVWALAPADTRFTVADRAGTTAEARATQEMPDLTGDWTAYVVRRFDLRDASVLKSVRAEASVQVRVQPESCQPQLDGAEPVARITTVDGRPIYARLPTLRLPSLEGMDPSGWHVRLTIDGDARNAAVDQSLRVDLDSVVERSIIAEAHLVVRGPLGIDLHQTFAFIRGLQVRTPHELLFPGDRHAPVTIAGSGMSVNGAEPGQSVALELPSHGLCRARIQADSRTVEVLIDVPKLEWATVSAGGSALNFAAAVVTAPSSDVLLGAITGLAVRTGSRNLPLELRLNVGGQPAQSSDVVRSGGVEGRWAFDLGRFRGTIEQSAAALNEFVLVVGQRPVSVLRLRPAVGVEGVEASSLVADGRASVTVNWRSTSAANDRVARLWPLDRPWESSIQEHVPDSASGVSFSRTTETLPPGQYLVEVDVDDGWTTPVRPRASAANTARTVIGDRSQLLNQLERLSAGNAHDILERTLLTGHIARRLDDDELSEIALDAVRALQYWIVEPDPGLTPPRGISTASSLLGANPTAMVGAVNDAAAQGLFDIRGAVRLALLLLDEVKPVEVGSIGENDLRLLWSTAPAIAARLDLVYDTDPDHESRLLEALNWAPSQGGEALFTGEPVDQKVAGLPVDRLRAIQASIDLVPKAVLDVDTLVVANFEWLIAASSGECDIEGFFANWRRQAMPPPDVTDAMQQHLSKRQAPSGTVQWASFPMLTLSAALRIMARWDAPPHAAQDLLWAAAEFAPRLVRRDLVLAAALHSIATTVPS